MEKSTENLKDPFKQIADDLFKEKKPNKPKTFLEVSEHDYEKKQKEEEKLKQRQLEEQQVEEFLKIIEKK